MSRGELVSVDPSVEVSVAAPSMAELEPSPNSETQDAASPTKVTRPRDQEFIRILVTLSK
jgi:hypothetical protein